MLRRFNANRIEHLFSCSSVFVRHLRPDNHHVKNNLHTSAAFSADGDSNGENDDKSNRLSIKELLRSMKLDKGSPNKDNQYSDRVKELHEIREAKKERMQLKSENENLNWKRYKQEQVRGQRAQRLGKNKYLDNSSRTSIKSELSEAIKSKKKTELEENRAMPKSKLTRKEVNQKIIESEKQKRISLKLAEATSAVAEELSDGDSVFKTEVERDLIDQLEKQRLESNAKLQSILAGMKVEIEKPERKKTIPEQDFPMPDINFEMMENPSPVSLDFPEDLIYFENKRHRSSPKKPKGPSKSRLFEESLGVFAANPVKADTELTIKSDIWEKEQMQEINSMINQPVNSLEEVIKLTDEGILWRYPIDNEQDILEEKGVSFSDHVFLDSYLQLFPDMGPIRHFVELVLIGLSKNAYLTLQEKQDHIMWYKDYFEQKSAIIEQVEQLEVRATASPEKKKV